MKIVKKAALSKDDEEALKDEIECLQELRHEHIIRLYDVFEEPDYYYLVTEKMMGGELFDRILEKSYYSEKEARQTCGILFEAIKYCHDHRVAHRDLKPENMLLRVSSVAAVGQKKHSQFPSNARCCFVRVQNMISISKLLTLVLPKK